MKTVLLSALTAFLFASQAHAFVGYATIKAQRQGVLRGEIAAGPHKDTIGLLSYGYEVSTPVDANNGQPSGKRIHHPLTITKEFGAATPQLFQAVTTNELLPEVKLEFYRADGTGREVLVTTIQLTNALVTDSRLVTGPAPGDAANVLRNLQELSFSFQKIQITDVASGITTVDDWN